MTSWAAASSAGWWRSVDPQVLIPRRAVSVPRVATVEGRIRREPGLCVACGRCVRVCSTFGEAGDALELAGRRRCPKQGDSSRIGLYVLRAVRVGLPHRAL